MTRITHRTIQESTLANLQGNLTAMSRLQEQLSTGKKINRPSDDPTATVSALQLRQELRANEQHTRNADDGLGWLNAQDTALQTTSSQLRVARTLVVKALNTGASSPESQAAIAVEVDGIRTTVQSLANTRYLGRNVFAGTSGAVDAVAPDPLGGSSYTFAPTGGTVQRTVGANVTVRVDSDGSALFGSDATVHSDPADGSVFALLDQISTEIKSPGTTGTPLSGLLTALDTRIGAVLTGLADVGARTVRLQNAQDAAADARLSLTSSLSETEDVDLPSTIVNLQMQQAAYQAALGATAKVLQPSLMDFLK